MRSMTSRARTASISSGTVTARPFARSTRPNRSMAVVRSRPTAIASALGGNEALEPARLDLPPELADVVGVLQHAAEGLGHEVAVEVVGVERRQRLRPVEGLRDARHLGEPDRPEG